jgi:hypothetical protein
MVWEIVLASFGVLLTLAVIDIWRYGINTTANMKRNTERVNQQRFK